MAEFAAASTTEAAEVSDAVVAAPSLHDDDAHVAAIENAPDLELAEGEADAIAEMKAMLKDAGAQHNKSDMTLLRFIRGRKGEVDRAFRLFQRHLAWRSEKGVDSLTPASCGPEWDKKKCIISGVDPHGRPTVFAIAGRHNKDDRDIGDVESLIVYALEEALKRSVPTQERIIVIFDLSGFSLQCMDYEAVKVLVEIFQTQYPDILGVAYIVNAPWLFNACWSIIRLWLDPVTQSKVNFVSADHIEEILDPKDIPAGFGTYEY